MKESPMSCARGCCASRRETMEHDPKARSRALPRPGLRAIAKRAGGRSGLVFASLPALAEVWRSREDPAGARRSSPFVLELRAEGHDYTLLGMVGSEGQWRLRNSDEDPSRPPIRLRTLAGTGSGGLGDGSPLSSATLRQPLAPRTRNARRERPSRLFALRAEHAENALSSWSRVHAGEHVAVSGEQVLP